MHWILDDLSVATFGFLLFCAFDAASITFDRKKEHLCERQNKHDKRSSVVTLHNAEDSDGQKPELNVSGTLWQFRDSVAILAQAFASRQKCERGLR